MKQEETFGEISFLLQDNGASASVLADTDDGGEHLSKYVRY